MLLRRARPALVLGAAILVAAALFPASSAAQVVVDYTEGRVEVAEGDSWRLLEVGEEIAADAQLRLANDGSAQLIAGESSVTLSRTGTFDLADLLPRIQAARRWDLAAVVGSKLTGLTTGRVAEETVMGVRGEAGQRHGVAVDGRRHQCDCRGA